jgi:hypothetical protein
MLTMYQPTHIDSATAGVTDTPLTIDRPIRVTLTYFNRCSKRVSGAVTSAQVVIKTQKSLGNAQSALNSSSHTPIQHYTQSLSILPVGKKMRKLIGSVSRTSL